LQGVGFLFVVSAITAAAVEAVPLSHTGMASAAISTARDFGMCVGPAVISALALRAASADLGVQLSASGLTPQQLASVAPIAHAGGPFAVLATPLGPITGQVAGAAAKALAHGFSSGLVVCGIASLVAAAATALWLRESVEHAQSLGLPVPAARAAG
jgi:hypothetical protein